MPQRAHQFRAWLDFKLLPRLGKSDITATSPRPATALTATSAAPRTMSSLDIAELTGKRHDHVMRDIKRMLEDLELNAPKFGAVYRDAKNEERPCFNLPKDLTLTLCAGYSTPLRHRIVTRWMELEQAAMEARPQVLATPTNMIEALRLAAVSSQRPPSRPVSRPSRPASAAKRSASVAS